MPSEFLLYGSTGFVGDAIARLAVQKGIRPILAGRNTDKVKTQANELGLEYRAFNLEDSKAIDSALKDVPAALHCAGLYFHTFKPMVDGCLRVSRHYLDISGEIPVYEAIAALDAQAKARGVMLLPSVGFDVVPTDCLAVHLKQRLPFATRLTLAFQIEGPAGLPSGTQRTMIELFPFGNRVRQHGQKVTLFVVWGCNVAALFTDKISAIEHQTVGDIIWHYHLLFYHGRLQSFPKWLTTLYRQLLSCFLIFIFIGVIWSSKSAAETVSLARRLDSIIDRIAIDPGFGGKDFGAPSCKEGLYAKHINLEIAKKLVSRSQGKKGRYQ